MHPRPTAALLALVASSCFSGYRSDAPATLRVHRGTLARDVTLTGELRAARGIDIAVPRLPSWQTSIKWIAADGDEVKQGARVVELDNSAFTSNLDAKRQAVTQAERELQQREAEWAADTLQKEIDVETKRAEYGKAKVDAVVPSDLLSAREYQDRQLKLKRAEVELQKATDVLRSQKAGVAADRQNLRLAQQKAQRELQTANDAIEELLLRAPRDGIVVLRDHPWEGRRLQEGDGVWIGMPLAQIPEMESLRAEAGLADVDDGKIALGYPATVVLDAYPSIQFRGRVAEISAVAQESNRQSLRRAFRVVVTLDRLDPARMRPGLSARVIVHRPPSRDAILAPRAALDFSAKQTRAKLASGKSVAVTVGDCNAQECVVMSGLTEGQELVPHA